MNTFPVLLGALCVYALAYRFYSAYIAAKALTLDDARRTPAHLYEDGHNYVPSPKWVLFGHHFAAIAGAGPLVGPTLAAQFGFAPGFVWLLFGAVFAGCVHDFTILVASIRHQGRSLAEIARQEISPFAGLVGMFAVLLILLVTLAGLGVVVVNALAHSPWGVFTIGMTIPIALVMGMAMFGGGKGIGNVKVLWPSLIGVVCLIFAVVAGRWFAVSSFAHLLDFNKDTILYLMATYGFVASVLPVWLLLEPRDYLSTYVKLGTVFALIVGVLVVHPDIKFPMISQFVSGGGPIVKGKLFPFLFVTIACGAISGFHSLVSSGTTPKMLNREKDARFIGYGAMICESIVGVLCLIAACSMHPGDYFAINTPPDVFAKLGYIPVNLAEYSREVGEQLAGRTGGAVSLAVGMAGIFRGIPGMAHLMSYWYHYAIMFEALFILTTIDTGTRVARYVLQELMGKVNRKYADTHWLPGNLGATAVVTVAWGYLILTGNITTLWPLFGTGNQLLATLALAVGTTFLVNMGRAKYAWITALPMIFVGITTISAGILSVKNIFWPMTKVGKTALTGYIDSTLMVIFVVGVILVLIDAARRCWLTLSGEPLPKQAFGPPELAKASSTPIRCC